MRSFTYPKLVHGLQIRRDNRTLHFRMGAGGLFELDLDSDALCDGVLIALDALREGQYRVEDLEIHHEAALAPYGLRTLLGILDEHLALSERAVPQTIRPGVALFDEVKSFSRSHINALRAKQAGARRFAGGKLSHAELEAWTIEYYFTTRFAEQCIISGANHRNHPRLRKLLEDFFVEEVGHDKLLERSLVGLGYDAEAIDALVPHISTEATMGMLLHASIYDLPLFIMLVEQLEGSEEQCRRYIALLEASGLPQAAIQPQIVHEHINIDHGHFGEALEMANALPTVTEEDIARCRRKLELFNAMRHTVYSHVFPDIESSLSPELLLHAWRRYSLPIRKAVLPVAIATLPESAARYAARNYVELRKVELEEWDPVEPLDVAASMLEHVLLKQAHQKPTALLTTLEWLDVLLTNSAASAPVSAPASLVRAIQPAKIVLPPEAIES